jgi:hypothetical protein
MSASRSCIEEKSAGEEKTAGGEKSAGGEVGRRRREWNIFPEPPARWTLERVLGDKHSLGLFLGKSRSIFNGNPISRQLSQYLASKGLIALT